MDNRTWSCLPCPWGRIPRDQEVRRPEMGLETSEVLLVKKIIITKLKKPEKI